MVLSTPAEQISPQSGIMSDLRKVTKLQGNDLDFLAADLL
jgi:hypothetical protein